MSPDIAHTQPTHLASAKLETYFDLSFAVLPHKIHQPEKFEADVVELRKRFVDKTRPDYVFQPAYHKRIPADGLSHYMEGIWAQVLANKDLDLPTQQELLAQFRCDELAAGVTEVFNVSARTVRRPIESGKVVPGLGKLMAEWLTVALSEWNSLNHANRRSHFRRRRLALPLWRVRPQAPGSLDQPARGSVSAVPRRAQERSQGRVGQVHGRPVRRAQGALVRLR